MAPQNPGSVTARVSSFTAAATSCSATVAKPTNRPPPATSAANKSLTLRAVSTATAGWQIPSTPPMVWDRTATSMPAASISSTRPSRVARPDGDHVGELRVKTGVARSLLAELTGEGISVIGMGQRGVDEVLLDGDLAQRGPAGSSDDRRREVA